MYPANPPPYAPASRPLPRWLTIGGLSALGITVGALTARAAMAAARPKAAGQNGRLSPQPTEEAVVEASSTVKIPWFYKAEPVVVGDAPTGWYEALVQPPRGMTIKVDGPGAAGGWATEGEALDAAENYILERGSFPVPGWQTGEGPQYDVLEPGIEKQHVYLGRFYWVDLPKAARSAVTRNYGEVRLADIALVFNSEVPEQTGLKILATPTEGEDHLQITFHDEAVPTPKNQFAQLNLVVSRRPWWLR